MKRTEYFNYTRPTEVQLKNTETSKIDSIHRRFRADSQLGILRGFRVRVNPADATKIDIGPGEGYTGGRYKQEEVIGVLSAERISTFTDSASGYSGNVYTVTGQALADYTAGTKNYVSLIYAETTSEPLAEKYYPFTIHETKVSETFAISVLSEADWNALSLSDLQNRFLVAIVTANGAGAALTSASIDQFIQPKTHPTTTQPSTITGVVLGELSQETTIGSATLRYESATRKLYWTAPGDAEGVGVTIPSSGVYTLYSDSTIYWIEATVVFASLPAVDATDSIDIEALYGRAIPMACAVDAAHRDMVGSGQPTSRNPHGTTLADLPGGTFTHADLFHVNGISIDSDRTQLQCAMDVINERVLINNMGGFANSFLIDGHEYELITGYAAGADGQVLFNVIPVPTTGNYIIYLDGAAVPQRVFIGEDLWAAGIQLVDMRNTTAGAGTITWDEPTKTLTWQAPGDVVGAAVRVAFLAGLPIVGYYKLYSNDTDNWVLVYIGGLLGASNASVINPEMNSTDHPEDNLLRLETVYWSGPGSPTARFDLRSFITADIKEDFCNEHDANGEHTRTLRNTLRVARNGGYGIEAMVENNIALYGYAAGNSAADVTAIGNTGGRFEAANYGLYGIATVARGVYGTAPLIGVMGVAPSTAVYGSAAVATGGYFIAPTRGIKVSVTGDEAVYATADGNFAGSFVAEGALGCLYASAAAINAVYGIADDSWAGHFLAPASALVGSAVGGNYGVIGIADVALGVDGRAPATAGRFVAAVGDYGASCSAAGSYGVFGTAGANLGVYGRCGVSAATAVYGYATHATYGTGVMGQAGTGDPGGDLGFGAFGMYGLAGKKGCGVAGIAGTAGCGVYGSANYGGVFIGSYVGAVISNVLDYSVAFAGAGALHSYVPIWINGVQYKLAIYDDA